MEMERAVTAATSLDGAIFTAKLGAVGLALKATYDFASALPDALKLLAAAAALGAAALAAAKLSGALRATGGAGAGGGGAGGAAARGVGVMKAGGQAVAEGAEGQQHGGGGGTGGDAATAVQQAEEVRARSS